MPRPKEDILKDGENTRFSKGNQPTGEAKSEGKQKANFLKNITEQIVKGTSAKKLLALADQLGIELKELDIETAMHLKQIEKALKEGDNKAYNSVMDRLKGKPKQEVTSDVRVVGLNTLSDSELDNEINELKQRGEDLLPKPE